MKRNQNTYNVFQLISALFMILALLWLTISAPFVFAGQQELAKQNQTKSAGTPLGNEEEATNPFGNNTEEKAPASSSFSEEYLHDHHTTNHFFSISLQYHKLKDAGTYTAFHGELHSPPPNAA
jgi:hypothetical protein